MPRAKAADVDAAKRLAGRSDPSGAKTLDVDAVGHDGDVRLHIRRHQMTRGFVDRVGPGQHSSPPSLDWPQHRQPIQTIPPEALHRASRRVDLEDGGYPRRVGRPDPGAAEGVEAIHHDVGCKVVNQPAHPPSGTPLEEARGSRQRVMGDGRSGDRARATPRLGSRRAGRCQQVHLVSAATQRPAQLEDVDASAVGPGNGGIDCHIEDLHSAPG